MTLRTCDSSVIHIAAICGTAVPTLDANRIAARSRVAKCLACLARRLSATASSSTSGLTNTSGGPITTSLIAMRPSSPSPASFQSNLQRRATSRLAEASRGHKSRWQARARKVARAGAWSGGWELLGQFDGYGADAVIDQWSVATDALGQASSV